LNDIYLGRSWGVGMEFRNPDQLNKRKAEVDARLTDAKNRLRAKKNEVQDMRDTDLL
jgi:hypothetical protein